MANVIIDIAAEFTGKKGFKQAETATDKMEKNVKKLAGALGLAFSGQAILAFGKASIKAAAEDEKAQKQLALALKNVGLSRDAASSEDYIQRLQSEFGILDDKLRPAYQTLAVATRDTQQAQQLLNLALDISASTGKDLGSVTSALSKAYLGNNTALSKLGVGISKADLKAGKFEDIVTQLETTFAGSATQAANTFQGSIDKLGVASANVQEIIGEGLIDAIRSLSDEDTVDNLAVQMQSVAVYTADVIRGIGVMVGYIQNVVEQVNKIPGLSKIMELVLSTNPIFGAIATLNKLGAATRSTAGVEAQGLADLARLQAEYVVKTLGAKKKLTAEEIKALKAARLKLAIDKANIALGKGQEVFDMEKIQNAAALQNQAELLAKSTTDTQRLQIANDTARLNVKQSISNLEDAIAAKDEAAIVAATNKLNADLKILGALTGQNVKLADIKSILEGLKPKDLINLGNLDAALAKIREMLDLLSKANTESKAKIPTSGSLGSGIPAGDYIPPISKELATKGSISAILEYADAATARATAFAELLEMQNAADELALNEYLKLLAGSSSAGTSSMSSTVPVATAAAIQSGNRYAAQAAAQYNITINAGVGSDPEAIARAIEDAIRQANQRGTTSLAIS
jgi:hypothetical protein